MVFGLIGLVFNLVTYPGIFVKDVADEVMLGLFGGTPDPAAAAELGDIDAANQDELVELLAERKEEGVDVAAALGVGFSGIDSYRNLLSAVVVPTVVCTLLSALVFLVGLPFVPRSSIPFYVVVWLGLSLGAHVFPNDEATMALYERSKSETSPLRFLGYPVAGVSKAAGVIRFLWLDALFALVIYQAVRTVV